MSEENPVVLGQKYAFATASLLLGLVTFVNILSLEKAILAVVFGWLALRQVPPPALQTRRSFAILGIVLGCLAFVLVPAFLIVYRDRLAHLIEVLKQVP